MSIHFDIERWISLKERYNQWWNGKLKGLLHVTVGGNAPDRPEPELPSHSFHSFYDFSVPASAVIDRLDYDLSRLRFFGDGFPSAFLNFGPGVMAAFLGAELRNGESTVWFHPHEDKPLRELRFIFNHANPWLRRVSDLTHAAIKHWAGQCWWG